ncbi:hypothetical protein NDU88_001659 [Pleurodeles waltl]|uniref:Uncharacterized protein n=1 Tax=Pleurodeles waltl TaxID=8319 RepID=A0AAV7UTG4_PLEWA|nr:hypothetical protein NDU88_001659 [Pleurodeles waltl]
MGSGRTWWRPDVVPNCRDTLEEGGGQAPLGPLRTGLVHESFSDGCGSAGGLCCGLLVSPGGVSHCLPQNRWPSGGPGAATNDWREIITGAWWRACCLVRPVVVVAEATDEPESGPAIEV